MSAFLRWLLRPLHGRAFEAHPASEGLRGLGKGLTLTRDDVLPAEGRFENLPSYVEVMNSVRRLFVQALAVDCSPSMQTEKVTVP